MKTFLITTATLALMTAPVLAQTATDPATTAPAESTTMDTTYLSQSGQATVYGSEFIGKNVYVTESADRTDSIDAVPADWENIATVEDILLSDQGEVRGVLVDVGGFLGMGARRVALDMNALDIVYDTSADDFYVVFTSNRAALEAAPEYDRDADMAGREAAWGMNGDEAASGGLSDTGGSMATDTAADEAVTTEGSTTDSAATDTATTGDTMATDSTATDTTGDTMATDNVTITPREGYMEADRTVLTAEELQDAAVYDANDETIGTVSEVRMAADGMIQEVILDIGGFLGMGEKPVAVPFDQLTLWQNEAGDDLRVYLPMTREQMEAMPTFEG